MPKPIKVIVRAPLPPLSYLVPDSWCDSAPLSPGSPVTVPLRNRQVSGIVWSHEEASTAPPKGLKEVLGPSTELPFLGPSLMHCLGWLSQYYQYPAGEVLRALLPPNPQQKMKSIYRIRPGTEAASVRGPKLKEALAILQNEGPNSLADFRIQARKLVALGMAEEFEVADWSHSPGAPPMELEDYPSLTSDQSAALIELQKVRAQAQATPVLLEGITGSGKTEVYLRLAEEVLRAGKSVLVVVPEIALTPQLVSRFQARLGRPMATLHSGLSDGERSKQWHGLANGALSVCIGARSAVLAPMENVGLVVVDEEHDGALKQEDRLRYHGRDLALVRAKHWNCPIILGSATPSLESLWNARTGRFKHLKLHSRPSGQSLPSVEVVDMRLEPKDQLLGHKLMEEIRGNFSAGGQTMLLLNRRGTSSFRLCRSCGFVPNCPHCSVTLTHYEKKHKLVCHYCNYTEPPKDTCPACSAKESWQSGTPGTEALLAEITKRLPKLRTIRIDRESTERKGELEKALLKIHGGEVDLVIGTQMIAKGHDFPGVTLVGIVQADSSLQFSDFRAGERAFQLFTQMAGRAGRSERKGRVILQTFNPEHPVIRFAQQHDGRNFSEGELEVRKAFRYPPFTRMCRIVVQGPKEALVIKSCERLAAILTEHLQHWPGLEVLGPAPAAISRLKDRYRWNLILKHERSTELHRALSHASDNLPKLMSPGVDALIDVDPQNLM
jgi:primosomal protein N' (replication factor Y) (superfamily II helicase)